MSSCIWSDLSAMQVFSRDTSRLNGVFFLYVCLVVDGS